MCNYTFQSNQNQISVQRDKVVVMVLKFTGVPGVVSFDQDPFRIVERREVRGILRKLLSYESGYTLFFSDQYKTVRDMYPAWDVSIKETFLFFYGTDEEYEKLHQIATAKSPKPNVEFKIHDLIYNTDGELRDIIRRQINTGHMLAPALQNEIMRRFKETPHGYWDFLVEIFGLKIEETTPEKVVETSKEEPSVVIEDTKSFFVPRAISDTDLSPKSFWELANTKGYKDSSEIPVLPAFISIVAITFNKNDKGIWTVSPTEDFQGFSHHYLPLIAKQMNIEGKVVSMANQFTMSEVYKAAGNDLNLSDLLEATLRLPFAIDGTVPLDTFLKLAAKADKA